MKEIEYNKLLFGFYLAGCNIAQLCKNNIMYTDYHRKNLLIGEDGLVTFVDIDDAQIEDFPREIRKYARAIMNFYVNFDKDLGAAFRFGFVHTAGEIGQRLYNILYNDHELSCLLGKINKTEIDLDPIEMQKEYDEWNKLISDTYIYQAAHGGTQYDEYYYIALQQKNVELFHTSKSKYEENELVYRYEYETYLANSLRSGNKFDFYAALVTLAYAEFKNGNDILSLYYYAVAYHEMQEQDDQYPKQSEMRRYVAAMFVRKYGRRKTNQAIINVLLETLYLRAHYATFNYYMEIWYWSDFQKEHRIDELFEQREFVLYKCANCGFMGFQESRVNSCDRCASKELLIMEIEDKINALIEEHENKAEEKTKIDLPVLSSVETIPIYCRTIMAHLANNELETAALLAKEIETYLDNHPEIRDDQGYVRIPAHTAGRIFRDKYNPNELTKLFEVDAEFVKHDYETEVYSMLCGIYMKQGANDQAILYAKRIIGQLNRLDRWIDDNYAKTAYGVLECAYEKKGDSKRALEYANICFTYEILHETEKYGKEYIEIINELGTKNARAENYGIALSCYYYALRNHIRTYGIQHPGSINIYVNIAKLYIQKCDYNQACMYYGFALMILEASQTKYDDIRKSLIEESLIDCVEKSDYTGTYEQWKKQWVETRALKPFPEDRFRKDKDEVEMLPMDEYISYDGYYIDI